MVCYTPDVPPKTRISSFVALELHQRDCNASRATIRASNHELRYARVVEIMRIKGIDPEHAPDNVSAAFQKSIELFGRIITPNLVMAHRPEIFLAAGRLNQTVAASTVVDGRLKTLAFVRTAQMIGCPF